MDENECDDTKIQMKCFHRMRKLLPVNYIGHDSSVNHFFHTHFARQTPDKMQHSELMLIILLALSLWSFVVICLFKLPRSFEATPITIDSDSEQYGVMIDSRGGKQILLFYPFILK